MSSVPSHRFSFFTGPPRTAIHTLSLHDALPISLNELDETVALVREGRQVEALKRLRQGTGLAAMDALRAIVQQIQLTEKDRKSTRLNSSHGYISYAVFCLKKKKKIEDTKIKPLS